MAGVRNRTPQIEIVERSEDTIKFWLSNTTTSVANALRRIILAEVPTIAIEDVEIHENSTVLFDEYICHRLGFIPIKCSLDKLERFKYQDECECEDGDNCRKCQVIFDLDVKLNQRGVKKLHITSNDLISRDRDYAPVNFSTTSEAESSKDDGIRICTIGPNQRLKLRCIARKGTGKIHSKWQPVATAVFQHEPSVKLNNERLGALSDDEKKKFVDCCPTKVFKMDRQTKKVEVADHLKCVMCDECVLMSNSLKLDQADADVVSIGRVPQRYLFTVESTGALMPHEIVISAINVLKSKLSESRRHIDDIGAALQRNQGSTKV